MPPTPPTDDLFFHNLARVKDYLTRATRVFARPRTFDAECPSCGVVYMVRGGRSPTVRTTWNPLTSTFHCQVCKHSFVVGLVFWDKGSPKALPKDQVPNIRQIAQLRAEGGGWWLPADAHERTRTPSESNLTDLADRYGVEDREEEDTPGEGEVKMRFQPGAGGDPVEGLPGRLAKWEGADDD